ncbi:MAG: glycosyltransferase family 2 protein [Myxococcota bacterium]
MISVVVPIYNEVAVLDELEARIRAALPGPAEIIFVDDQSTDGSTETLSAMAPPVRHLRQTTNGGQWQATRAGLQAAEGDIVVVLDGDLQDPPELIPALVQTLRTAETDVVFATRTARSEPLWFLVGRRGYRLLQFVVNAGNVVPSGVGSYCAMRSSVARRAARVRLRHANLAAVLVSQRVSWASVPYRRDPRADGPSRVGLRGLVREALGSLYILSPLSRG